MHKQLRLKPLKNNQMGSIFHLWVCFVGCDEFKMPGSRTRKANAAVSNDRRTLPRFFKQRRGRVARGVEREFLVCVASFFCESASNAVKRRDAADTKKNKTFHLGEKIKETTTMCFGGEEGTGWRRNKSAGWGKRKATAQAEERNVNTWQTYARSDRRVFVWVFILREYGRVLKAHMTRATNPPNSQTHK